MPNQEFTIKILLSQPKATPKNPNARRISIFGSETTLNSVICESKKPPPENIVLPATDSEYESAQKP
jgi:hypothetical protein